MRIGAKAGKSRWWMIVVLVAGLAVALPASAGAADSFYWANGGVSKLSRANLDGSGGASDVSTSGAGFNGPIGLAINPASNSIYLSGVSSNTIVRVNLDGTGGGSNLITTGATVGDPAGVAIDPATNSIYWANNSGNTISRANLDGTGGGSNLNTIGATVNGPYGLAIDPASNSIYWASNSGNTISRANLDGTGLASNLNTSGATVSFPGGLAIDAASNSIYWTNSGDNTISRANLDGTGGGSTLNVGGATPDGPVGLAIDAATNSIYWGNFNAWTFWRANLDGTGGAAALSTAGATSGDPRAMALLKAPLAAGLPIVSGGGVVGQVLSCTTGTWAASLPGAALYRTPRTFARQWTLDGADIGGATGATYTPTTRGTYGCVVTASNFAGPAAQTSAALVVADPPAPPPASWALPLINVLSPAAGPTAGGTVVTISGAGFGAVQRVVFDDTPAAFTVDRFDRLTAVAPPHAPGAVRVSVVTDAGTSGPTAASVYTYSSVIDPPLAPLAPLIAEPIRTPAASKRCNVPNVVGRTEATAKRRITAAGCTLGTRRTRRSHQRTGRVIAQSPRPGASVPASSKVSITLARTTHHTANSQPKHR